MTFKPFSLRNKALSALICIFLLGTITNTYAVFGEVVITGGAEPDFCRTVGEFLTGVINVLEKGDLSGQRNAFTDKGYEIACELLQKVPMSNARPVQETRILTLQQSNYEVRDVKVYVEMGDTPGSPFQYLVFTLDDTGRITDIRFAIENTHYQHFIEEGERLQDFSFRQKILQFVEIFRTAYNRKDIEYLRRVYSDDALIIVGRMLKTKPDMPDMLEQSNLGRDKIQFIRKSKAEYIESLDRVFRNADFLKVVFDSVEVVRHEKDIYLYGVTLRQHWNSSTYSDKGWVFLMIDFIDQAQPIIHVRSWQPEPFKDGSVISLYEFQVVR